MTKVIKETLQEFIMAMTKNLTTEKNKNWLFYKILFFRMWKNQMNLSFWSGNKLKRNWNKLPTDHLIEPEN
jgi:hypothetical protein